MPLFLADDLVDNPLTNIPSLIGQGLLPERGILLLTGRTGIGKSLVAFDICFSLILEEPLFKAYRKKHDTDQGKPIFPVHRSCKILYLDGELGPIGCQQRLQAFYKLRCPDVRLHEAFKIVTGEFAQLSLHEVRQQPQPYKNLRMLIEEHKPDILVVDPIGDYHTLDEDDNDMRFLFRGLRTLQHELGFASIVVHHESDKESFDTLGKIIRKEGTGRSRGHSSITQSVDTMLALRREVKSPYCFLEAKWEKVRHQSHPLPGYLFADFRKMLIGWHGPLTINPAKRQQFIDNYKLENPLPIDEDIES